MTTIKWNAEYNGVHIKTDNGLSFILSGQPSMYMNWHDAVRFYKEDKVWQLPTPEHLKLISVHIGKINAILRENGGREIKGWHWTAEERDEFLAWIVGMYVGYTCSFTKSCSNYVRAVAVI